jgi:hypothetical protein
MADKLIYYAHPMSWYDTEAERKDIEYLGGYGKVINPNTPRFKIAVDAAKRLRRPVMELFTECIQVEADVVCYRSFRDGMIGAGVAQEILAAVIWGKEVWHIVGHGDLGFSFQAVVYSSRILTVENTRNRIMQNIM